MNYVTFAFFEKFLLDLVADPINRHLGAYECWEAAKQRLDQKVSVFKAYLEELKAHLPPSNQDVRANFFLAKLKPELKEKILATGNVPKQWEKILAQAIMQEKNLECTNANHRSSGGSHLKCQGVSKSRSLDNRVSRPNSSKKGSGRGTHTQDRGTKRKAEPPNPDHKNDTCYYCQKVGHQKPDCPDRDKPSVARVAATGSKKDEALQLPQKRSKKDDK